MNTWKLIPLAVSVTVPLALSAGGAALLSGCSTREVVSGGVGAAAGYEYANKRELDQLDADYKAGRITKQEYDRRKHEIESRSVVK